MTAFCLLEEWLCKFMNLYQTSSEKCRVYKEANENSHIAGRSSLGGMRRFNPPPSNAVTGGENVTVCALETIIVVFVEFFFTSWTYLAIAEY